MQGRVSDGMGHVPRVTERASPSRGGEWEGNARKSGAGGEFATIPEGQPYSQVSPISCVTTGSAPIVAGSADAT